MESSQEIRYCSNCTKPFAADRVDLHQAYCIRNIKKCQMCDSYIDIHDISAHQEEFHQKKPCSYCRIEFMPEDLKIHGSQCPRRPRACVYCQTDIAAIELNQHELVCGARTRVCNTCQQPIMLKDFFVHETRCREQPPVIQPVSRPAIPINPVNLHERNDRNNERRNNQNDRERDISGNNIRHIHNGGGQRSLSTNKQGNNVSRKTKQGKYHGVIPPQTSKPMVEILPISIQITINNSKRQNRQPLTTKNAQV